ncbi:hypothetical protein LCGC14_0816010 [marine sediment metagenome]|uniref:Uncharacterized protein n=1 Tax=marine sediment metagenome TaxID=412755 RepID=A0A0F9Q5K4_9ZZZZ
MGIHLNGDFERYGNVYRENKNAIFAHYENIKRLI